MEYISPSAGYELTTLVVIVTDFIGTGSDPETLLTRGGGLSYGAKMVKGVLLRRKGINVHFVFIV
jgi:hypothetical protein